MTHAKAALTPRHRLRVAQLVVEQGWPISEAAARFQVSWPTVKRWADRYRTGQSMQDRSSRPHHSPNKVSAETTRRCIKLRLRLREGPVQLACCLGVNSFALCRPSSFSPCRPASRSGPVLEVRKIVGAGMGWWVHTGGVFGPGSGACRTQPRHSSTTVPISAGCASVRLR